MKAKIIVFTLLAVLIGLVSNISIVDGPYTLPSELLGIDSKVNAVRAEKGLKPLKLDGRLSRSAAVKAKHMETNNYWSHDAPDGTTPWSFIKSEGVRYSKAGENLAKCHNTIDQAVSAWVNSPAHYKNIVGEYSHFGFGHSTNADGCIIIVNHFANERLL